MPNAWFDGRPNIGGGSALPARACPLAFDQRLTAAAHPALAMEGERRLAVEISESVETFCEGGVFGLRWG